MYIKVLVHSKLHKVVSYIFRNSIGKSKLINEHVRCLIIKILEIIFIPQFGPVFFKLFDFIFGHISLNLPFNKAGLTVPKQRAWPVSCLTGTTVGRIGVSGLVGFVIDTSDDDQNNGYCNIHIGPWFFVSSQSNDGHQSATHVSL